jgi:hypothetical protein
LNLVVIRVAGTQAGGDVRVVIGRGRKRLGDDVLREQAVRRACEGKPGLVSGRIGPGKVSRRTAGRRGAQALGGGRGRAQDLRTTFPGDFGDLS